MSRTWQLLNSVRARIVVVAFVLVACGLAMARFDNRPVQERAKAWAISHQRALPTTLEELAAYPAEYQREIFRIMTPDDKSRLWRTKLHSMVVSGTLTTDQRAFVVRAIDLVTPEAFASATPPDLCPEIAGVFVDKAQRAMFRTIGAGVSPAFAWRAAMISLAERVQAKLVARASDAPCDCRGNGFCECPGGCSNSGCTLAPNACGCIFDADCDKLCSGSSPIRTK